jgi:hypothetical protein
MLISMNRLSILALLLLPAVAVAAPAEAPKTAKATAAAPSLTIPQMEAAVLAHEKRTELLRTELKDLDARIESRANSIVNALTLVGDTKDSGTKVARMKVATINALKTNITYYRGAKAARGHHHR